MNRPTLSIALITLNEEKMIGRTLNAVRDLADEIIVVDSGSTDETVPLAESLGAHVFKEEWKGFSDQKNSALAKCKGKWILSLDADEVITDSLGREIQAAIEEPHGAQGFRIAREFYLGDRLVKRGGYFPDFQLRLIRNGIGARFKKRAVHESILLEGKIRDLRNPMQHFAYENLDEYQQTLRRYAKLARTEIGGGKIRFPLVRATWAFLYRYVIRLGFMEGTLGWKMARIYAGYVKEKYSLEDPA